MRPWFSVMVLVLSSVVTSASEVSASAWAVASTLPRLTTTTRLLASAAGMAAPTVQPLVASPARAYMAPLPSALSVSTCTCWPVATLR